MKIYNKEKWEKVKLGEIFELQMGKTPSRNKENYWRHGENSWISISDMKNEEKYICDTKEKITDLAVEESKIKVIPKDTVIMSFKLSIGKLAITSKDMFTNEAIMAFFPKDKVEIDNNYLFYSLKKVNWTEGTNKAVKGLTLNKPLIASKEILLPSIQIQKEIAKRLDIVMEILKAKRKILLQLDELSKCLFEVEFLNKSYYKYPLCECTTFIDYRGRTPQISSEGTIQMINAKSVGKNNFKYIDEFVTEEIYNLCMTRGLGEAGDILFVTEGHTFGNVCIIPENFKKFALGQRVITIRGKKEQILNKYLCYYMQTEEFKKDINMYKTGGTAQGIRSKDLGKILIPIPELKLQNQFAERVKLIEKSKFEIQKSIEETQKLFDSLMEKYFG